MSNQRLKGYRRDKAIVHAIEKCEALTTEQVDALLFADMKAGYRKAQERLLKLYQRKQLKRFRPSIDEPYVYHRAKKQQWEHRLAVNWIYIWLSKKKWHELVWWGYEQDYGVLVCDAFAMLRNPIAKKYWLCFVEVERDNHSKFDKVGRYSELYVSEKYLDRWWAKYADGFPAIVIACGTTKRKQEVEEAIKKGNDYGLDFRVYTLDSIIRSCRSRSGR